MTIETEETENISGVEITINEDNADSLIGATVEVDGQYCGTITEIPDDVTTFTFDCENGAIAGKTVTITTADDKVLSLNEVVVISERNHNFLFLNLP